MVYHLFILSTLSIHMLYITYYGLPSFYFILYVMYVRVLVYLLVYYSTVRELVCMYVSIVCIDIPNFILYSILIYYGILFLWFLFMVVFFICILYGFNHYLFIWF